MARQVEGKPAIAEDAGLQAGRIGHGDDKRPAGGQERSPHGSAPGQAWRRCSSECQKMTADQFPSMSSTSALRMCGPDAYGSRPTASRPWRTKASTRVPSPASHVENRAGRQDPVQTVGER